MAYDAASRVKQVANWDATINLEYFDDNLLKSHQELTGSNYNHTNIYAYDADGNRQSLTYPFGSLFQYNYTGRNQLGSIANAGSVALVTYQYDRVGNRLQRSLYNGTVTDYAAVDALNRSSWVKHSFNGTEKARFDYAFDEVSRLKYEQRDSSTADGYGYDGAGQLTGFNREGTLGSSGIVSGGIDVATLDYDPAGNRARVTSNETTKTWSVNDLNEYTSANGVSASSDVKGNLQSYNGWTYTYDAQNRLTNATDGATSVEFWYDGLNRQITRRINGSIIIRSVWDGWNLIEEHDQNDSPLEYYIHGARTDELVVRFGGVYGDTWYAQDGRGNTSHLFDYGGIVERYTYGLDGETYIWNATGTAQRTQSSWANRFMFQGREYLSELAIYDYRNRFYLPSLGRFIQSDPLGFGGGDANLFRFCGGDPVNGRDPSGLLEKTRTKPSQPPIRPRDAVPFGSNGYTPTGSHIPQSVSGVWNGSSWDLSTHDYVNGTQSLGSFVLLGGLSGRGSSASGGGGGAQFVSTSTPLGSAIALATKALDDNAAKALKDWAEYGGTVTSSGGITVNGPGTEKTLVINVPAGAQAIWHFHLPLGPGAYDFSKPPTGTDSLVIQQFPNIPHVVGVLDGPPGQFTIFAAVPGNEYYIERANFGHTPGFPARPGGG